MNEWIESLLYKRTMIISFYGPNAEAQSGHRTGPWWDQSPKPDLPESQFHIYVHFPGGWG